MKQVLQNYRTGELELAEVPAPTHARRGQLLVETRASVVSVGTEKAIMDVAKKSLVGKALARPDWVKQVVDKVRTEGPMEAYRQSMARLEAPVPMGYSSAGVAIGVGEGVAEFAVGDRVACAGSGYASHAEVVCVPRNLCVKIPEAVDFESAAFVALGGIALEAVRMAGVELGHRVAVIGLGLLGQLTVQLLKAAGCYVLGMDPDPDRCQLAVEHGAEATATDRYQLSALCRELTGGLGVDAVIIMAVAKSNEPIELAAEICRERGRVVATGLVGLEIPRKAFYEKELDFVVSRAWGPGTYDPDYEERDVKYPPAYVRWTAQANMAEFLAQVANKRVRLDRIITHRFPIEKAIDAYNFILEGKEPSLGVVLTYSGKVGQAGAENEKPSVVWLKPQMAEGERREADRSHRPSGLSRRDAGISLIGAGLFARGTLLPALRKIKGFTFHGVATSRGLGGRQIADKFGFAFCTTDADEILRDEETDAVLILTRHDSHAHFVTKALRAGKHVFVEKPLALNEEQLHEVVETFKAQQSDVPRVLMVGFNRRFAPTAVRVRELLAGSPGPFIVSVRANAGYVPPESWVHDPKEGGGRIIGEVCHFVDLIQYLTGGLPIEVHVVPAERGAGPALHDNVVINLRLDNGSSGCIVYSSGGDKSFPREYVEVFGNGAAAVIDNFKTMQFVRAGKKKKMRTWGVDRGHAAEMKTFVDAVRTDGPAPVEFREYVATTLATFAMMESIRRKAPVAVDVDGFLRDV
jgi:predicted dehydrogenase/threonine dehydrogenase-like Zn-dependent dehydrogenase